MKNIISIKKVILFGLFLLVLQWVPFSGNVINTQTAQAADDSLENIRLNIKSNKNLVLGEECVLRVYNLEDGQKTIFKSSDSNIVKIKEESRNKVTLVAKEVGTAKVTVIVKDGFWKTRSMTITIQVGPPAQSVKLTDSKLVLKVGEKATLKAILKPSNTVEEGKFKSNDSSVVSVTTSTGYVTALTPGTATITVTIENGGKDTCAVKVIE